MGVGSSSTGVAAFLAAVDLIRAAVSVVTNSNLVAVDSVAAEWGEVDMAEDVENEDRKCSMIFFAFLKVISNIFYQIEN
jgi:hypothetical protein